MPKPRAMVSWSGGKDCFLAWQRVKDKFDVAGLFTMMTEDGSRSRSHGLRPEILQRQAGILGLPHLTENASWAKYESAFSRILARIRALGVSHIIFGDIYPEANRIWAENAASREGLLAVEPLFGEPTKQLAQEFISTGATAVITTIRLTCLDRSFLGQTFTTELVEKFVQQGVDPCGERGEFHTAITRFSNQGTTVPVLTGSTHIEGDCAAIDLLLSE